MLKEEAANQIVSSGLTNYQAAAKKQRVVEAEAQKQN
jgi:hypothetical protein